MKKKCILLSLMSMLGVGMASAQTAYAYVKQGGSTVAADGVAEYSISSGNIIMEFDDDNNAVMKNSTNTTVAKLDVTEGGVLTADFDNQSGESTTGSKTVTVGSAGYGTFYSPFQVKLPESSSVAVYTPTYESGKLKFDTEIADETVIPAGTGLLLKNTGSIVFTFSSEVAAEIESGLTGTAVTLANPTPDVNTSYEKNAFVLANKTAGVAFYQYVGTTLGAGKAYVMAPLSEAKTKAAAKAVVFDLETNDIQSVESEFPTTKDSPAYNALGQRVNAQSKGMVIINGKKYLNK